MLSLASPALRSHHWLTSSYDSRRSPPSPAPALPSLVLSVLTLPSFRPPVSGARRALGPDSFLLLHPLLRAGPAPGQCVLSALQASCLRQGSPKHSREQPRSPSWATSPCSQAGTLHSHPRSIPGFQCSGTNRAGAGPTSCLGQFPLLCQQVPGPPTPTGEEPAVFSQAAERAAGWQGGELGR